jgi:putative DNA modification/repair radical SAM protein
MSINLELPTADSLRKLAPHKNRTNILTPMKQIQIGIHNSRHQLGLTSQYKPTKMIASDSDWSLTQAEHTSLSTKTAFGTAHKYFVPAGQSTQMIIGATEENDYQLLVTTESLYQQFDLKRVFFSAFIPVNEDKALPSADMKPPLLREHRLYQADWLLRFYGFTATELLTPDHPNFNTQIDPKCDWAVRHLDKFPLEIMSAGYYELLRVPGIGVKSAKRIIAARRMGKLHFNDLKKMGVVMKRAQYFITCNGHMLYHIPFEERFITNQLIYGEKPFLPEHDQTQYTQPTLFDMGLM